MNIALPAVVIFLLVIPGFLFRAGLKRADRETLDYSPFGRVVGQAFSWALLLHGLWLLMAWLAFGRPLDVRILAHLLAAEPQAQARSIAALSSDIPWVLLYFVPLYVCCWAVPPIIREYIVKHRLDRAGAFFSRWLRFDDAPWYYLLHGADLERKPFLIYVSAIVELGGKPTLYDGVLLDYVVDSDGKLDRLILQAASRWDLADFDGAPDKATQRLRRHEIFGHYFILSYDETLTLNIRYVHTPATAQHESPPSLAVRVRAAIQEVKEKARSRK